MKPMGSLPATRRQKPVTKFRALRPSLLAAKCEISRLVSGSRATHVWASPFRWGLDPCRQGGDRRDRPPLFRVAHRTLPSLFPNARIPSSGPLRPGILQVEETTHDRKRMGAAARERRGSGRTAGDMRGLRLRHAGGERQEGPCQRSQAHRPGHVCLWREEK